MRIAAAMAVVGAFLLCQAGPSSAYTTLTERSFVEATQGAPNVIAVGSVLSWEPIGSLNAYVLRRKVPGRAAEFAFVRSHAVQPPVITGTTVGYSVKSAVEGGWSPEVFISYPATLQAEPAIGQSETLSGVLLTETRFSPKPTGAPSLSAGAGILSWSEADPGGHYVLRRTVPGHGPEYALVSDTSALPPAVPGQTVAYTVRPALGIQGSSEVPISYPGAGGETLWSGAGLVPLYNDWAAISDQEHCAVDTSPLNVPDSRIKLVTDSRFARGLAIHYHMNTGDRSCFFGRSEYAMGPKFTGETWPDMITRGHEGWYAFQVLFPSNYPLNSPTVADGGVMQIHGFGGSGLVPFGISAGRNCDGSEGPGTPHPGGPELGWLKAWVRITSAEYKEFCLSKEIHANQVYNVVIHARFTEQLSGLCEVFLNGTRVMSFTGPFGFLPRVNSILRSGLYPDTARSESPAMDVYEAGWTLATTRETAEAGAF